MVRRKPTMYGKQLPKVIQHGSTPYFFSEKRIVQKDFIVAGVITKNFFKKAQTLFFWLKGLKAFVLYAQESRTRSFSFDLNMWTEESPTQLNFPTATTRTTTNFARGVWRMGDGRCAAGGGSKTNTVTR